MTKRMLGSMNQHCEETVANCIEVLAENQRSLNAALILVETLTDLTLTDIEEQGEIKCIYSSDRVKAAMESLQGQICDTSVCGSILPR